MDPQTDKHKKTQRAPRFKIIPKKLLTSGLLLIVLFLLTIFVQKPQTITEQAATGNQTSSCSPVPFYCLILGGQKTCTHPPLCPTPPPPTAFVAQKAPPPPPKKATNGTPVKQPVCGIGGYYSGYSDQVPANTTKLSVSTAWTVSATTCSGNAVGISQWPGVEGGALNNLWLAQTGTYGYCVGGAISYFSWAILVGVEKPFTGLPTNQYPTKPGDKYSASVVMSSPRHFTSTLTNITRGWTYTKPMTVTTQFDPIYNDFIILENEGHTTQPLTKFTPATFSQNTFSLNSSGIQPFAKAPGLGCVASKQTGPQETAVSNLINGNFTITWLHP